MQKTVAGNSADFESAPAREHLRAMSQRCWSAPTAACVRAWLSLALLVLSGCFAHVSDEAADESSFCENEEVSSAVRGELVLPESMQKSAGEVTPWLTVYESSSVRCDGEYEIVTSPGSALLRTRLESHSFDLPVRYTSPEGRRAGAFELELLLDQNGNGSCDEGELVAFVGVSEDGTPVRIDAFEPGCLARL